MSKKFLDIAPADVWELVFECATTLTPFVQSAWRSADPTDVGDYDTERVIALQTQRALPLICRSAYCLGLKYLFSRIHLFNYSQFPQLLTCLENSQREKGDRHLGSLVREVVLDFNLARAFEMPWTVTRVFKLLPRLNTFVDRASSADDAHLPISYDTIAACTSLQSIVFDSEVLESRSLCEIVNSCTMLTTLAAGRMVQTYLGDTICSLTLRTLHIRVTDSVANFFTFAANSPPILPNLAHLTILNAVGDQFPLNSAVEFLLRYGNRLTSFDWRDPRGHVDFSNMLQSCPNLERLEYGVKCPVPKLHRIPLRLTSVGFHNTAVEVDLPVKKVLTHISRIHAHVIALKSFTNLKSLDIDRDHRTLASDPGRLCQQLLWWRRWVDHLQLWDVEVKDMTGQRLQLDFEVGLFNGLEQCGGETRRISGLRSRRSPPLAGSGRTPVRMSSLIKTRTSPYPTSSLRGRVEVH